uniref:ATP-dependent DNA helicase n=1 Tax=Rhizophagus irregularis (strain DAOM 181602 / DAOM 197198 / MUCL 43194) TaxID=747089 RepID=U9UXZ1_RHIID
MKALNPNLEGKPFGGKVVLFGGDFRQILPVAHVNVMKLKINMCLFNATNNSDTAEQAEFAKWLLEVEEGRVPAISKTESDHIIILPEDIVLSSQLSRLK